MQRAVCLFGKAGALEDLVGVQSTKLVRSVSLGLSFEH
jgi:hypothetical protein